MPTYKFLDTTNNEEFLISMKISELDEYKKENPNFQQQVHGFPMVTSDRVLNKKPDDYFRDVLRQIKKGAGKNNTVNTF